jgi:hypothetical protein
MNGSHTSNTGLAAKEGPRGRSRLRIMIPGLVFFVAGAALSAIWFSHSASQNTAAAVAEAQLSDATKSVLQHLDSPVEIRFYSRLDASSVQDSVQAFAGRVDQLLIQYEKAAGNRLTVIRYNSVSNFNANAADADGIKAFNIDKGDSCYLGIAVVCDGQKESLSHLAPEWEQALEPDLTRAISRAAEAGPGVQSVARADTATLDAVRRAIPNVDAVSLEEGTKVLRDAGLAKFMQAAQEMEAQVKDAQGQFLQAQGNQSEAAAERLRKIQTEGADKLQQIALNSHAQIAALQQLKKASP